jgi:aspartate/glutamate racemase
VVTRLLPCRRSGCESPSSASAVANLVAHGAQCILLGCTEIGLLIGAEDADVPIFDTTILHAQRAVELALPPAEG